MKVSKPVSALLFLAVVVVWGLVIWKVITALSDPVPVISATGREAAAVPERQAALLLNYRDPFLKKNRRASSAPADTGQITRHVPAIRPDQPPPFRYKGVIGKKARQWLLLEKGRETHTIDWKKEGRFEDYHIERVYPDSLVLSRTGKRYVIQLQ